MKRSVMVVGVAVALMAAWSVGRVQGQKGQAEKVVFVSADHANFVAMNPSVSMAAIWGDSKTGAHAQFASSRRELTRECILTRTIYRSWS